MAADSMPSSLAEPGISEFSTCVSVRSPWAVSWSLQATGRKAPRFQLKCRCILGKALTNNAKPIRILVVDDHFMVRMGLTASLNAEPDMEVVAEVGNGEGAVDAFSRYRPNLVIMDVRLPGMSGAEATAAILREFPEACILMLSTHSGEEEIYRAMQAGARGYVLKSVMREDLLRAIRDVRAGKRHLDPIVASHLAERLSHRSLTARELEVLRMVAKGWGNKEI